MLGEFTARNGDTQVIARLTGATVALAPEATKPQRHAELKDRLDRPRVHIDPAKRSLVSSTPESPFAVELLVKALDGAEEARPREAHEELGKAFVDVKKGELYEVRVHNRSKGEAAVTLTIDGLDLFTFSDVRDPSGKPRYSHLIVPAQSSISVVGWHRTNERADSFLVTEYGKGAASRLPGKAQGQVGVLTVSFADCFEGDRCGAETGFGPPRETRLKEVKRSVDPPHDFVSVRYTR